VSTFRIEFDSDLEQATWAAAAIRGIASLWVDDEMKLYQVELAAAEGVNNAASYSQGTVEVDVSKTTRGLTLRIWSVGKPLEVDLGNLEDPRVFDVSDMNSIEARGRGFFILQQLASSLSLEYVDGKNCLSFCVPLKD
jgi:anti-sigma regulatory factor (Ser/Thr protein kinase)